MKTYIGKDNLSMLGGLCKQAGLDKKCVIVTDIFVPKEHGLGAAASLNNAGFEPYIAMLPFGERAKSVRWLNDCWKTFAARKLDRDSFVVAVGGGCVGDVAGFAAATWMRGIPIVQVPTTLVAQVDSAIGGKTGINLPEGKNLVGSFLNPTLTLIDISLLKTLNKRQFNAGMSEVIKYGLIASEPLFNMLERFTEYLKMGDTAVLLEIVRTCARIKTEIVVSDPYEQGERAKLNFGHTIGHAIEAAFKYKTYNHGEAIATGQIVEALISQEVLGLDPDVTARAKNLMLRYDLPCEIQLEGKRRAVLQAIGLDKKARNGEACFTLLKQLGEATVNQPVPMTTIEKFLR